jgi:hypothetical protein
MSRKFKKQSRLAILRILARIPVFFVVFVTFAVQ